MTLVHIGTRSQEAIGHVDSWTNIDHGKPANLGEHSRIARLVGVGAWVSLDAAVQVRSRPVGVGDI